jgi:hypothetical protein
MAEEKKPDPKATASANEAAVADAFNNAKKITLEFEKYTYNAEVAEIRLGKFIILKITKPDQGLIDIPLDYALFKVRVFTVQGKVLTYPAKMVQRKLPFMVMAYPEKEEAGFARSAKRLFVKQTVLIIRRKKDNVLVSANAKGMGILTDLSPGGCSVQTKLELAKSDKVLVYLNVSETKEPVSMELLAVVRRAGTGDNGYGEFGMEWVTITDDKKQKIIEFLKNHPAAAVATR